jgi:hypothetical protein
MDAPAVSDFPVTRRIIERLDEWVMALASPLLPLGEFPRELNGLKGFRWDFSEKTERALMVGKAVRMPLEYGRRSSRLTLDTSPNAGPYCVRSQIL